MAFTLIELLVIVTIIALVAGVLLPALTRAKAKSQRIGCVSRLKQIGLSFRIFAADNGSRYPMARCTNQAQLPPPAAWPAFVFSTMSNELSVPLILACPADTRKPAANWPSLTPANVSYFVGLQAAEEYPQAFLAGDRNLTTNGVAAGPGLLPLRTKTSLGWTDAIHRRAGNIALGDGSVQQFTEARLREQARGQGPGTNWLAIP